MTRSLARSILPLLGLIQLFGCATGQSSLPSSLPGQLYGKTGSCPGNPDTGTPDHGWFIGWVEWNKNRERNPATNWFVLNIQGEGAWGTEARRIAQELLEELQP